MRTSDRKYELLLAAVIAARATSFMFNKLVLTEMEPFNLMALRFSIAFLFLLVFFGKRLLSTDKKTFLAGAAAGISFFLVMTAELIATKTVDSSTIALLENCSIIFVPLFQAMLLRKLPTFQALLGAVIAFLGVACLTRGVGGFSVGMLYGLLSAVLYAITIILIANLSRDVTDVLQMGIIQVLFMALCAVICAFAFDRPHLPYHASHWPMILALSLIATVFGFTLQPMAQSRVSAERAGILCALSPAVAAVLGAVFLHEQLTLFKLLGIFLILLSIVLPYLLPAKE